jgi:pimeloyl-ACP methyl ester carboxylesterase
MTSVTFEVIAMEGRRRCALYFLSFAVILSGFAGVIAHSISFSTQSSNMTNTYKTSWFAAVFAISGLNLLQLLTKAHFSKNSFWFELAVIVLLGCSSFISLVCLGYSQEWPSFAWVFVTYFSVAASAIYLLQCKNGSVSDENQTRTVTDKVITAGLYLLKVLFMLIVSLLASGSILSAIASSYQPTGRPISVLFDGANRNGTLQIYCIGNSNISKPTIFIFSSSAHGIVDLYGLQFFLSTTNGTSRRVCIHDPLGFGWSQDPFDGQFTNYEYLYRLMLTSNESMPWHIVGWGGGGSAIMYLVNNHTSSIKSVTFVETYPPGIEFSYYGYQNGLSQQAISEYRSAQISSRIGLVQLILSMAIPWGLMGLFIPISPQNEGYYPPERWSEFRVQMWKSKVWISQYQGLQHLQMTSDSQDPLISFAPLSSQIPVFGVYCNTTVACEAKSQNGQDCTQLSYYNTKKFSMIRGINPNATIDVNSDVDCNLNLPVQKPSFTASSILKLYSGIEV